ncbi:MAG: helical backbone metal receptor [Pseudomonadota bacterium]
MTFSTDNLATGSDSQMQRAKDQMGRTLECPVAPQRIVSLVPSQTELLFDLGLGDRVLGVTRYCIHPSHASEKTIIGGTKRFDFPAIASLQPDLILGNKEENYAEGIEKLAAQFPVWMSDIETIDAAIQMILSIGIVCGESERAAELVNSIRMDWLDLPDAGGRRVLYLIWKKPYMAAGPHTFIHDCLSSLKFENLAIGDSRYPALELDQIREAAPDVLMLSSEPFPFTDRHVTELSEALPDTHVCLVDGELFSWYGSRMRLAPAYFRSLLGALPAPLSEHAS